MAKAQHFQLSIRSEASNLSAVADFIAAAAGQSGLNDRDTYNIQMAVDEAVTNVIEHAYRGRTDGRIDIYCERHGNDFIVEIQDFGKPFDAARVPTPRTRGPLARRSVGGLGVFFMRKLMDTVEFNSTPGNGNRVRMVKHIR